MYKTMHEKANSKTTKPTAPTPAPNTSQTQPPITRAFQTTPAAPQPPQSTNANATPNTSTKLDKTLFDLLTDVTAELIVESAKLDRLGRYLTKNPKDRK